MTRPSILGAGLILLSILLGVAVSAGWGIAVDRAIASALGMRAGETQAIAITFWQRISWFGGGVQRYIIVGCIALFLATRIHWRSGLIFVIAALSSNLASDGLKVFFARLRPDLTPHLDQASSFAYPSGHATSAALVYLLLVWLIPTQRRWLWLAAAALMILLTGLSRILLGVHWTSDVIGGCLLGAGFAALGLGISKRLEQ